MATIKPRGQVVKNLKQWIKKIPTTKRINPSEFHNVCHSLKVDIEFATEGLEEIKFCLRENGQSNKADAIGKLYNQLLSSVSTEYHKRSDGLAPIYLELSSAKKNAALLLAELEKIKPGEKERKAEGSRIMITAKTSKENWEAIKSEYDISKKDFGKKINFVSDSFKRKIIFRDVEHAFVLASQAFSKPALILAGGVIEELLRLYLEHKNIKLKNKRFVDYIKACEDNKLLKRGVFRLSDSIRDFRNLVHLDNEKTKRHTVSKATAKGAVSSIFTIANDFQ